MIIGLIKGLIVGIIVSIPVGPLGLLCIPRTLARGRWSGLSVWVLLAGGLIICITGINLIVSRHKVRNPEVLGSKAVSPAKHTQEFLNGFLISVTNPGTLVCMLWLFTFIGIDTDRVNVMLCEWTGVALGSGCTWFLTTWLISIGSGCTWFLTTWLISIFRDRITLGQLRILTRISGSAILIIGLSSIIKSISRFQIFV